MLCNAIFLQSENDFRTLYKQNINNATDIPTRSFADEPEPAIDSLLSEDSRIIFAWVNRTAGKVLSLVSHIPASM